MQGTEKWCLELINAQKLTNTRKINRMRSSSRTMRSYTVVYSLGRDENSDKSKSVFLGITSLLKGTWNTYCINVPDTQFQRAQCQVWWFKIAQFPCASRILINIGMPNKLTVWFHIKPRLSLCSKSVNKSYINGTISCNVLSEAAGSCALTHTSTSINNSEPFQIQDLPYRKCNSFRPKIISVFSAVSLD